MLSNFKATLHFLVAIKCSISWMQHNSSELPPGEGIPSASDTFGQGHLAAAVTCWWCAPDEVVRHQKSFGLIFISQNTTCEIKFHRWGRTRSPRPPPECRRRRGKVGGGNVGDGQQSSFSISPSFVLVLSSPTEPKQTRSTSFVLTS